LLTQPRGEAIAQRYGMEEQHMAFVERVRARKSAGRTE